MRLSIRIPAKARLIFVLLLLALVCQPSPAQASDQTHDDHELELVTIVSKGVLRNFTVEIASTRNQRNRGLMFRRRLPDGHGMLLDFGREQEVRMWMKDTLVPLDMIFIRSDGRIHRIEKDIVPGSLRPISSDGPVRAVLEVAAGTTKKFGIAPGDQLVRPLLSLPR